MSWFDKTKANDKDYVLKAVSQNGYALQYASDELKNDKDVLQIDEDVIEAAEPELDPEWHKDENRNHIPDEYENIGDENRNGIPDEYENIGDDDFDDDPGDIGD